MPKLVDRLRIVVLLILLVAANSGCGGSHSAGSALLPGAATPAVTHASSGTCSVSGITRKADYTGIASVTLTFTNSGGTAMSDGSGNYTKGSLNAGTYTITPSKVGWTFTPASKTIAVSGTHTGINFVGTPVNPVISGNVHTANNTGLYGVTVTLSGSGGSCTTNSQGDYSKSVAAGTYTVTPSKDGWFFTPASKSVTIINSSATGINFVAERTAWAHTWGGSDIDSLNSSSVDASGNTFGSGVSCPAGALLSTPLFIKYDTNGTLLWRKKVTGSMLGEINGCVCDSSGNLYAVGEATALTGGNSSALILKLDTNGNLVWQKLWGGSEVEVAHAVAVDSSNNIYVTGYAYLPTGGADIFLLKLNSNGDLLWQRNWGGGSNEQARALCVNGSSVYITGYTTSFGQGEFDCVLVRYSTDGVLDWRKVWGGANVELGTGVGCDSSGNIYVGGSTYTYGGGEGDFFLLKYSSAGALTWRRTYGWANDDQVHGLCIDNWNGIYLVGNKEDNSNYKGDVALLKYTTDGAQIFRRSWGNGAAQSGYGIAVDAGRRVRIAGTGYDTTGSWANLAAGTELTSVGTAASVTGTGGTPTYSLGTPTLSLTSPGGTIDTGGGDSDTLMLKYGG